MPEQLAIPITPVLGDLDLDQILRRTLGAATHRPTLSTERGERVRIMVTAMVHVLGTVLEALETGCRAGNGDMAEGAFTDVHEFAVAPVRAGGEIGPVVFARVE
jgi:hypothetical protein